MANFCRSCGAEIDFRDKTGKYCDSCYDSLFRNKREGQKKAKALYIRSDTI